MYNMEGAEIKHCMFTHLMKVTYDIPHPQYWYGLQVSPKWTLTYILRLLDWYIVFQMLFYIN